MQSHLSQIPSSVIFHSSHQAQKVNQGSQISLKSQCTKQLLQMTVELGAGKQANIKVFENDDPYELADQFCKSIGLEQEAVDLLAQNIKQNIQEIKNQEKTKENIAEQQQDDIDKSQNESKTSKQQAKTEEQDLKQSFQKKSLSTQSQNSKDIFDRLYSESKIKKQNIQKNTEQNLKTINDRQKSPNAQKRKIGDIEVSIGEYLYFQGLREKEQKNQLVDQIKMEEQKVKTIEYTYSPKMTVNSQIQLKKIGYNTDKLKFEDHMKQLDKIQNEKKEIIKNQHIQQQLNQCPFRPQINKISEQIIQEKERMNPQLQSKFEILYEEAIRINMRKNDPDLVIYDKNVYTFQPAINLTEGSNISKPFIERMQDEVNRKQACSRTESNLSAHNKVDKSEFRPVTGRSPKFNRNSEKLPIGQYLYNQNYKKQHYQKYFLDKLKQEQNLKKIKPNNKSNLIVQTNYIKKLKEIFDVLDSDGDGLISAKNINLQSLSADILETFSPILCNMEIDNRSLNIYQFIEQCIILIQSLNIPQRDKIFNNFSENKWAKEHELEKQKYNFKPIINDYSKKLAEKKKTHTTQSKQILKTSQQQEEKQLKECTFKPKLYRPLNIYEFTNILSKSQQA